MGWRETGLTADLGSASQHLTGSWGRQRLCADHRFWGHLAPQGTSCDCSAWRCDGHWALPSAV